MIYTFTYTDCAGNSHVWNYTYTIDIPDFTLPADGSSTVNCPADATAPTPPTCYWMLAVMSLLLLPVLHHHQLLAKVR